MHANARSLGPTNALRAKWGNSRTQTSKEGTLASCYSCLWAQRRALGACDSDLWGGGAGWLCWYLWGGNEADVRVLEKLQTGFSVSHRNKLLLPGWRSIAGVTLKYRKENGNRKEQVPFDSFTLIVTLHWQSLMGSTGKGKKWCLESHHC